MLPVKYTKKTFSVLHSRAHTILPSLVPTKSRAQEDMTSKSVRLIQTIIVRRERVLLGRWKKGPFEGRYSGFIGERIGEGTERESVEEAAARTVRDLSGVRIDPDCLEKRARFEFHEVDPQCPAAKHLGSSYDELQLFYDGDSVGVDFAASLCNDMRETNEMIPEWFAIEDIPYAIMPEDDKVWYPHFLAGARLTGRFVFNGRALLEHSVEEVSEVP